MDLLAVFTITTLIRMNVVFYITLLSSVAYCRFLAWIFHIDNDTEILMNVIRI